MVKANHALSNSALKYENLHANYPVCNFFLNPAAEIMFNTLFNIILKTKPGHTERRRRKKKNKEGTFTTIFAAGLTSSFLLRPTEVNLSDANKKNEFRVGYCDIRISRNSPSLPRRCSWGFVTSSWNAWRTPKNVCMGGYPRSHCESWLRPGSSLKWRILQVYQHLPRLELILKMARLNVNVKEIIRIRETVAENFHFILSCFSKRVQ